MISQQFFRWDWIFDRPDEIWTQFTEHLWLTFLAVGIGFLISFPTAIVSYRHRRIYGAATATSGVLYTIPSLALFGALVPITGLSFLTAEIGLVSYTLLILIRNMVEGLRGVSEDAREAARGMGYTERQLLFRVELPLALPAIMAGLRIATVTTIGLVTVTGVIGFGGFGHFIFLGLIRTFPTAVILGAVLSLVLAIATDWFLIALERWLSPWSRMGKAAAR
jgi:osmoprotectant transport system permease protein